MENIKWEKILEKVYNKYKNLKMGKNADYIPVLKKVNPNLYSISICTIDGKIYSIGEDKKEVAIESVSKIFSLALALKKKGIQYVLDKIGDEKSYESFNSIHAITHSKIHTLNSFNNGGAMATTSISYNSNTNLFTKNIYHIMSLFANKKLTMSKEVFDSEYKHSEQNQKIAYLLNYYQRFYGGVEKTLEVYTRQCSAMVNSKDIAIMASVLANKGISPITKKEVLEDKYVSYILKHMINHGLYEESDKWKKDVGYPAKSGVGGVILCVIPNLCGIGVISPPLDKQGNSVRGKKSIQEIIKLIHK